jgi:hypothetical protein
MRTGRPPKAAKITRICKNCGDTWQAYKWDKNRTSYCSHACFSEAQVGKRRQLVKRVKRACATCGKVFLIGGAGNRKKISKYCSRSCAKYGHWGEDQHPKALKMKRDDRIWFAGIFDGEGCIAWPRRNVLHSVRLDFTSTTKLLVAKVAQVTGTGRVAKVARSSSRHSPAWRWCCYGNNSLAILRQIHPWLIVKKEAAEVALGIRKAKEPPWTQRTRSMNANAGTEEGRV